MSIRETLPAARKRAGVSAQELADKMGNHLTRDIIAKIESGRRAHVTIAELVDLCDALECDVLSLAPELAAYLSVPLRDEIYAVKGLMDAAAHLLQVAQKPDADEKVARLREQVMSAEEQTRGLYAELHRLAQGGVKA